MNILVEGSRFFNIVNHGKILYVYQPIVTEWVALNSNNWKHVVGYKRLFGIRELIKNPINIDQDKIIIKRLEGAELDSVVWSQLNAVYPKVHNIRGLTDKEVRSMIHILKSVKGLISSNRIKNKMELELHVASIIDGFIKDCHNRQHNEVDSSSGNDKNRNSSNKTVPQYMVAQQLISQIYILLEELHHVANSKLMDKSNANNQQTVNTL